MKGACNCHVHSIESNTRISSCLRQFAFGVKEKGFERGRIATSSFCHLHLIPHCGYLGIAAIYLWDHPHLDAIYGNIYHQYTPNVSIYTIHGSYGYVKLRVSTSTSSPHSNPPDKSPAKMGAPQRPCEANSQLCRLRWMYSWGMARKL